MKYKVVPFAATVSSTQSADSAANALQSLIDEHSAQGWEYVRLEMVETNVAPSSGCFGIGAQPGFTTSVSVAVFKQ